MAIYKPSYMNYRDPTYDPSDANVDECATNTHKCTPPFGTCLNRVGSPVCRCSPGFERIGNVRSGRDFIHISTNQYFVLQICELQTTITNANDANICNNVSSVCVNSVGLYGCTCLTGFYNVDQLTCAVSQEKNVMIAFIVVSTVAILTTIGLIVYTVFLRRKLAVQNPNSIPPPIGATNTLQPKNHDDALDVDMDVCSGTLEDRKLMNPTLIIIVI
ncbi:hypothetical protein HELRODRAFT_184118 [Helobdella robusta]|uniref:EGF-like domain-containing protein n=1 Tax=Helobdella robusta TaxID=6412 RepID=T1FKM1_HELRO|nr:hypothetical protein HELRODRAFT_184118 [Helobdella robusta]ESO07829.1 hypothetical protein HELRODRAFT_184118 [Helobdella robusta]